MSNQSERYGPWLEGETWRIVPDGWPRAPKLTEPPRLEKYLAQPVSEILRTLGNYTAKEVVLKAYELGLRTGHSPRALATALGWRVIDSTDPEWEFGLFQPVPERNRPWIAVMPPFAAYEHLRRANVALAHWIYLVQIQLAGLDTCCTPDDLAVEVAVHHGDHGMKHWWEASVWARNFFGTNAIFQSERLASDVRREDVRRNYVMHGVPQRPQPSASRQLDDLLTVWDRNNGDHYRRALMDRIGETNGDQNESV